MQRMSSAVLAKVANCASFVKCTSFVKMRELRQMRSLPKPCLNPICQGWYNRAVQQTLASDQVAGDNHEDMSSL
jgi:hypothetical protein